MRLLEQEYEEFQAECGDSGCLREMAKSDPEGCGCDNKLSLVELKQNHSLISDSLLKGHCFGYRNVWRRSRGCVLVKGRMNVITESLE
jgi:hypothetical protein